MGENQTFEKNPAERLVAILEKAPPPGGPILNAFAKMFDVHASPVSVMRQIGLFHNELDTLRDDIRSVEKAEHDEYIAPLFIIERLFSLPNLESGWGHDHSAEIVRGVTALKYCGSLLRSNVPRASGIPADTLEGITQELNNLFGEIQASDAHPRLKALLLQLIESMRRAIAEYRIGGAKRLRRELATILEAIQRSDVWVTVKHPNTDDKRLFSKFWSTLEKVDLTCSVAVNAPTLLPLFAPAFRALEAGLKLLGP